MGLFSSVFAVSPKRSMHDLSYTKKYTCKFGQLIPSMVDEYVPGDVVSYGNLTTCRLTPMNAPVLDELIIKSETFFVPYRLLWPDFEKFITGVDSSVKWSSSNPPEFEAPIPCKVIRPLEQYSSGNPLENEYESCKVGSLQDYFGFPVNLYDDSSVTGDSYGDELTVNAWPWLAYYKIWNDYYRDENLEDEIDLSSLYKDYNAQKDLVVVNSVNNGKPLVRSWKKDYFTSALPFRQKGTAPALPIFGSTYADFSNAINTYAQANSENQYHSLGHYVWDETQQAYIYREYQSSDTVSLGNSQPIQFALGKSSGRWSPSNVFPYGVDGDTLDFLGGNKSISQNGYNSIRDTWISAMNKNVIDTSRLASVDTSQMRLMFSIQRFLEANARAGTRYTEFLRMHFNCSPTDERLDRAEFIGSTTQTIVVSEVLQTTQTSESGQGRGSVDNSLGAMGGHGLSVAGNFVGKYRVKEFGIIMTLTSIYPKPSYQQGINRQWLRKTKYDFLFPEFTGLSEQNILDKELYVDSKTPADNDNQTQWGFQGRLDEMRYKPNLICGHFRSNYNSQNQSLIESGSALPYSLDYWHLGRFFGSKPELNKDFINIDENGEQLNRIFVVPSEDYCLVDFVNYIKAVRPLPYYAVPGGF